MWGSSKQILSKLLTWNIWPLRNAIEDIKIRLQCPQQFVTDAMTFASNQPQTHCQTQRLRMREKDTVRQLDGLRNNAWAGQTDRRRSLLNPGPTKKWHCRREVPERSEARGGRVGSGVGGSGARRVPFFQADASRQLTRLGPLPRGVPASYACGRQQGLAVLSDLLTGKTPKWSEERVRGKEPDSTVALASRSVAKSPPKKLILRMSASYNRSSAGSAGRSKIALPDLPGSLRPKLASARPSSSPPQRSARPASFTALSYSRPARRSAHEAVRSASASCGVPHKLKPDARRGGSGARTRRSQSHLSQSYTHPVDLQHPKGRLPVSVEGAAVFGLRNNYVREKSGSLSSRSCSGRSSHKRISSTTKNDMKPETQNVIERHVLGDICSIANCNPKEARLRLKRLLRKHSQPLHKFLLLPKSPIRQSIFELNPFLWKEIIEKPIPRKRVRSVNEPSKEFSRIRTIENVTKIPVKNSMVKKQKGSNASKDDRNTRNKVHVINDPFLVRGKSMSIVTKSISSAHFNKKSRPPSTQHPTVNPKVLIEVGLDIPDSSLLVNSSGKFNRETLDTVDELTDEDAKHTESGKESVKEVRVQKVLSKTLFDASEPCVVDMNSQNEAKNNYETLSRPLVFDKNYLTLPMETLQPHSQYANQGLLKADKLKHSFSKSYLEKNSSELICVPIEYVTSKTTFSSEPITHKDKKNKRRKHRNGRIQLNYSSFPYIYYNEKTIETKSKSSMSSISKMKKSSKRSRRTHNRKKVNDTLKIEDALDFPDFPLMGSPNFETEPSRHMISPCNEKKENVSEFVKSVDSIDAGAIESDCAIPPKSENVVSIKNEIETQPLATSTDKSDWVEVNDCRKVGDGGFGGVGDSEASFGAGGEGGIDFVNLGGGFGLGDLGSGNDGRGGRNGGDKHWMFGARGSSTGDSPGSGPDGDALKKCDSVEAASERRTKSGSTNDLQPENCTCLMRSDYLKGAKRQMKTMHPVSRHRYRVPESLFGDGCPKGVVECAQAHAAMFSPPETMAAATATAAAAALEAKRKNVECGCDEDAPDCSTLPQTKMSSTADDPPENKSCTKRPQVFWQRKATACMSSHVDLQEQAPCGDTATPSTTTHCSPPFASPCPSPTRTRTPKCAAGKTPLLNTPDEDKYSKKQTERGVCATAASTCEKIEERPTRRKHREQPPRPSRPSVVRVEAPPTAPEPKAAWLRRLFGSKCPSAMSRFRKGGGGGGGGCGGGICGRRCFSLSARARRRDGGSEGDAGGEQGGDKGWRSAKKSPGRNRKKTGIENKYVFNENSQKTRKSKAEVDKEKAIPDILRPKSHSRPPYKSQRTNSDNFRSKTNRLRDAPSSARASSARSARSTRSLGASPPPSTPRRPRSVPDDLSARCRRVAWTLRQKLRSASSPRVATPLAPPDVDPGTLASLVVDADYLRLSSWNDFSVFPAPPEETQQSFSFPKTKQRRPKVCIILDDGVHKGRKLSKCCSEEVMKRVMKKSATPNIAKIVSKKSKEESKPCTSEKKSRHPKEKLSDNDEKTKKSHPSLHHLPEIQPVLKEDDRNLCKDNFQEHTFPNKQKCSVRKSPKPSSKNNTPNKKETSSHNLDHQEKSVHQKEISSRTIVPKIPFPPDDFNRKMSTYAPRDTLFSSSRFSLAESGVGTSESSRTNI